ncbi:DUF2281 domain-containing protein [Hymenobacter psoromatis]|nr:DUF2281 domain-containing protein [Hymenobacter psoromatis]
MSASQLSEEIASLPPELQAEVQDFVSFLKTEIHKEQPPLKERQFGAGKG